MIIRRAYLLKPFCPNTYKYDAFFAAHPATLEGT